MRLSNKITKRAFSDKYFEFEQSTALFNRINNRLVFLLNSILHYYKII